MVLLIVRLTSDIEQAAAVARGEPAKAAMAMMAQSGRNVLFNLHSRLCVLEMQQQTGQYLQFGKVV